MPKIKDVYKIKIEELCECITERPFYLTYVAYGGKCTCGKKNEVEIIPKEPEIKSKYCKGCETTKPIKDFYLNKKCINKYCKLCTLSFAKNKNYPKPPNLQTKVCSKCKVEQPKTNFYKKSGKYLFSKCKGCCINYADEYRRSR